MFWAAAAAGASYLTGRRKVRESRRMRKAMVYLGQEQLKLSRQAMAWWQQFMANQEAAQRPRRALEHKAIGALDKGMADGSFREGPVNLPTPTLGALPSWNRGRGLSRPHTVGNQAAPAPASPYAPGQPHAGRMTVPRFQGNWQPGAVDIPRITPPPTPYNPHSATGG